MFKPGDKVKIEKENLGMPWYNDQSFKIVKFLSDNVVELDKSLYTPANNNKAIHVSYLCLDIKETRKEKLQKIYDNKHR